MSFSFILPQLDPLILPRIMTLDVMHSCSVVCLFFELLPMVSALIYYFFFNISTVNYFLWETRENLFFPAMFSIAQLLWEQNGRGRYSCLLLLGCVAIPKSPVCFSVLLCDFVCEYEQNRSRFSQSNFKPITVTHGVTALSSL